ncbi:hypothetical protein MRX96_029722 [Rhipicephalus microplus]
MAMPEAQPYRVAVATVAGDVEYHRVLFAGESPPKRLVCALCRTVSATEPRYARASGGDFACRTCAGIYAQPTRRDRGDSAELEGLHDSYWNKLPQPQHPFDGDVRLLNDSQVRYYAPNAWLGCDFRGKLSILGSHLAFSCTRDVVKCRTCGRRIVRRDLCQHACTSGCSTSATPDATEDRALVWSPQFVNWSRQSVVPDWEQVSAARTNLVVPATLNGTGPSVIVPAVGANHRNWPGRARPTLQEAPESSGHLPPGSLTQLAGTLLVRFPDCTPPLGDALKKTADSPVHSSRVKFFGSDQLVVDGFRLAMSAMIFYDFPQHTSGLCCNSPAALAKLVVFELLAKGRRERQRRLPPQRERWMRVVTTEAVDAQVVSERFLVFGVVGVAIEF